MDLRFAQKILPLAGASSSRIAAASKTSPLYSYLLKNTGFGDVWWHIPGNFWFSICFFPLRGNPLVMWFQPPFEGINIKR